MKILSLIFFIFLFSCSTENKENLNNNMNFSEINDINKFIQTLKKYSEKNSYPDINK